MNEIDNRYLRGRDSWFCQNLCYWDGQRWQALWWVNPGVFALAISFSAFLVWVIRLF